MVTIRVGSDYTVKIPSKFRRGLRAGQEVAINVDKQGRLIITPIEQVRAQKNSESELLIRWHSLTSREQDVTALTYRGYTNSQIAVKLGVSQETVKVHVAKALAEFGVHGKAELRNMLEGWNFSEWE